MRDVLHRSGNRWLFWCPGCECAHYVNETWTLTGGTDRPTIRPSILVTYNGPDAGQDGAPKARCHSFVTGGSIEFLGDSTHALAGKTVSLPPWERDAAKGGE